MTPREKSVELQSRGKNVNWRFESFTASRYISPTLWIFDRRSVRSAKTLSVFATHGEKFANDIREIAGNDV